jgi:inorganic pyrophosphatase
MNSQSNDIPVGKKPPEELNVIVEIPSEGKVKYEVDKKTNTLFVDRFLYTSMYYPFNYGYVPQTLGEDEDPIDVLVLSSQEVAPASVLPTRIIGLLEMEDEEGIDTKFMAVPTKRIDPFLASIEDVSDLDQTLKEKIRHFFEQYKALEPGKWVKIKKWKSKDKALPLIKAAINRYKNYLTPKAGGVE